MPDTYTIIRGNYASTLGLHVATARITYTVPAGKRAQVEYASLYLLELTASAVANANITLLINGAIIVARVDSQNTVGAKTVNTPLDLSLSSGDILSVQTANAVAVNQYFQAMISVREYS